MKLDEKIIEVGTQAAREAGKLIKTMRDSGEFEVRYKGALDLVTTADLKADALISEQILKAFPDHKILSEESAPNIEAIGDSLNGPLWIIDPIDGTTNYAHGHQMTAVSIAFAYGGQVQFGVVEAPFMNETFIGVRGKGSTLNGKPLKIRQPAALNQMLVATGFPYKRDSLSTIIKRVEAILLNCRDIRRLGACSLDVSWIAAGRIDAYYEDVKIWDIAAAGLIASEAGAKVGHILDLPKDLKIPPDFYAKNMLVAPPEMFGTLQELLRAAENKTATT